MPRQKRALSDAQGWVTLHFREERARRVEDVQSLAGSRRSPSSGRSLVAGRRPQRRWVELLGTVMTQLKEQDGTVLSFFCIRDAVVFKHNHDEAHIVEIVMPTRSVILEIESRSDLMLWLAALTKAVAPDYLHGSSAERDAIHASVHQLLRYELESAHIVVPLERPDGEQVGSGSSDRSYLAIVFSIPTREFAICLLTSRAGQDWSIARALPVSSLLQYEVGADDNLSAKFSMPERTLTEVTTVEVEYTFDNADARAVFSHELSKVQRIVEGGAPTLYATHDWLKYYEDEQSTNSGLPFVRVVKLQEKGTGCAREAVVTSPAEHGRLVNRIDAWYHESFCSDMTSDEIGEQVRDLVGFAKRRGLIAATPAEIYAARLALEESRKDHTRFPQEFLLEISSTACSGLSRAAALGCAEDDAGPETDASSIEEETDEEEAERDETGDARRPALWMRGGRKSINDLVETAASELESAAQLAGWLQLERKKGLARVWCVLINLDAVGVVGQGMPPDRIILCYSSAAATKADGSIFLREGKYQVRPPKTDRKGLEHVFRISTIDEHLAELEDQPAASADRSTARGGRRSSIDLRSSLHTSGKVSKVSHRRSNVVFSAEKHRVSRALTTKKSEGKYIFAADTNDDMQKWKGAMMDHWITKFVPACSRNGLEASSEPKPELEPQTKKSAPEPEPEQEPAPVLWEAVRSFEDFVHLEAQLLAEFGKPADVELVDKAWQAVSTDEIEARVSHMLNSISCHGLLRDSLAVRNFLTEPAARQLADVNRLGGQSSELLWVEAVWEKQRRKSYHTEFGYDGLTERDGPPFSDAVGATTSMTMMKCPPEWEWVSEWTLDNGADVDAESWQYAMKFRTDKWSVPAHQNDLVRRRLWLRVRRHVGLPAPDALAIESRVAAQRAATLQLGLGSQALRVVCNELKSDISRNKQGKHVSKVKSDAIKTIGRRASVIGEKIAALNKNKLPDLGSTRNTSINGPTEDLEVMDMSIAEGDEGEEEDEDGGNETVPPSGFRDRDCDDSTQLASLVGEAKAEGFSSAGLSLAEAKLQHPELPPKRLVLEVDDPLPEGVPPESAEPLQGNSAEAEPLVLRDVVEGSILKVCGAVNLYVDASSSEVACGLLPGELIKVDSVEDSVKQLHFHCLRGWLCFSTADEMTGLLSPVTPPGANKSSLEGSVLRLLHRCVVRESRDTSSSRVCDLAAGEVVQGLEEHMDWSTSQCRIRCALGWLSVTSISGENLLIHEFAASKGDDLQLASTVASEDTRSGVADLVGKKFTVLRPVSLRASPDFRSEELPKSLQFGDTTTAVDAQLWGNSVQIQTGEGWTSIRSEQGNIILTPHTTTVLFRCLARCVVRKSASIESDWVGRLRSGQVIEVLDVKRVGGKFRFQFSSKGKALWISEVGGKGDALLELVDMNEETAEVVDDEDDTFALDFFKEPMLTMSTEDFAFVEPEPLDHTQDLRDSTYVATLCCIINGNISGQLREDGHLDAAPAVIVEDDCAFLRRLLLPEDDDATSRAKHLNELLPRALDASAKMLAEYEVQLWCVQQQTVYTPDDFPADCDDTTPFATWMMLEQMRLSSLIDTIRSQPQFNASLTIRVQSAVGLVPPGSWKGKDMPQVSLTVRIGDSESRRSTSPLEVDLKAGAVTWNGEELHFHLQAEAPVYVDICVNGCVIGSQRLELLWSPAPHFTSAVLDIPCLWKDVKQLKVSGANAAKLSTIVLEIQFSRRKNLPSQTADRLAIGELTKANVEQTMLSFHAQRKFRCLVESVETSGESFEALQWIVREFGEAWGIAPRFRYLCELQALIGEFVVSESFFAQLVMLLEDLADASDSRLDPLAETAAYRAATEHIQKVLLRCLGTYKTTFPEALEGTDTMNLAIEVLQLVCAATGQDYAELARQAVKDWPCNVVERLTGGALRDDADNLSIGTRKQQALSASMLLRLADVVIEDIQTDDIVYQWAFPEEVQIVNIVCQEYYSWLQNGVFQLMFNSDDDGYSTESTLKLFMRVRDLHETISYMAPTIRLQNLSHLFDPILEAHLHATQVKLIGWAKNAAEAEAWKPVFDRREREFDDDPDENEMGRHAPSVDDVFRMLAQNVQPLLSLWRPPELAPVFCNALRAYCDTVHNLCEQDLPDSRAMEQEEILEGSESVASTQKSKWSSWKEKKAEDAKIKRDQLQAKATITLKATVSEEDAAPDQCTLIEQMYASGAITASERDAMLVTARKQIEFEKVVEYTKVGNDAPKELTTTEAWKRKAAEKLLDAKEKSDARYRQQMLRKSQLGLPDSFWVRLNSLWLASDQRLKELAYDGTELFGSVAGYNERYSDQISEVFTRAMVASRNQMKALINRALENFARHLTEMISRELTAAASGDKADWSIVTAYLDESLQQPAESLYPQVFHRLLMHCFDTFCRVMELILRAETKVANFATPGPAVNSLTEGISEISAYFYDNGEGLPERIIDAQTDEYSRLSQLLDLHRLQTQELLDMRKVVDEQVYEAEETAIQPLLDALWLSADLPLPGYLQTAGERPGRPMTAEEAALAFMRSAIRSPILLLGSTQLRAGGAQPFEVAGADGEDESAFAALVGRERNQAEAAELYISSLSNGLAGVLHEEGHSASADELATLAQRVAAHLCPKQCEHVASNSGVDPQYACFQPTYILLVNAEELRVVTYCFVGGPLRSAVSETGRIDYCSPYLMTLITSNLLVPTATECSSKDLPLPAAAEQSPTGSVISAAQQVGPQGQPLVKAGWFKVEEGKQSFQRYYFSLWEGGVVCVAHDDDPTTALDYHFKLAPGMVTKTKKKRKEAPQAFRIDSPVGKLVLEADPPTTTTMWMMLMEQQAALAGPTVPAPVSEAAQAAAARRAATEEKRKDDSSGTEPVDNEVAGADESVVLTYSVRGVSSVERVADAIEADRAILVALHQGAELCDALEHSLGLAAAEMTDGLELRLPGLFGGRHPAKRHLDGNSHSDRQLAELLPTTEDEFWTLAEDEDAKTFLALQVLSTRYHDPIAVEYVAKLGQHVPRSLGLPKTELLRLQCLVDCRDLKGHLSVSTSFVCFESQRGKSSDRTGESSEDENDEDDVGTLESERWTCPLTELQFLKKESATMLELGRVGGEIMLLECFQKKDLRDAAFSTVVNAALEFGLDLSDREGAWSAVRGLLQLPAQEPLVDEFRCHSESFVSEKNKGEGRLYITPYYLGWTEGRGQSRLFRVELLTSVHSIGKKGPGIEIHFHVDGVVDGSLEAPTDTNADDLVLVGFLPRARDKALTVLLQLHQAAQAQLQQFPGAGHSVLAAPALRRSCSAGGPSIAADVSAQADGAGQQGLMDATVQGWLNMLKRGGLGLTNSTKSVPRWCQLRGPLMMYSERVGGKQIGFFHLGGAKIMCNTSQRKERTFSIKLPARTYVLQADSQAMLEQWLEALRLVAKESAVLENPVMRQSFSFNAVAAASDGAAAPAASDMGESTSQQGEALAKFEALGAAASAWKRKAEAKQRRK